MRFRDENGWILFDWQPQLGRQVWYRENPDGTTTFRTDYEVQATIDANTAARNVASPGWSGDWHRVASIPLGVLHDPKHGLVEAFQQDDMRHVSRFLNDADNRAFRTKSGAV